MTTPTNSPSAAWRARPGKRESTPDGGTLCRPVRISSEEEHPMSTTDYAGQQCAIYPRVSSDAQAEEQKNSLAEQEREARSYAQDTVGMIVDEVCVMREVYTSTVTHRPVLNRLLATMHERGVRNLVIDRADRLTREG